MTRFPASQRPLLLLFGDCALAALLFLAVIAGPDQAERSAGRTALVVALAGLVSAPIALRRIYPAAVLAVVEGSVILHMVILGPFVRSAALALAIAVYTVAARLDRRLSMRLAAACAAVNAVFVLFLPGQTAAQVLGNVLFSVVLVVGSWAIGDNLRTRRAYLAGVVERADRLERDRAQNERRAVQDERVRIARELHDVVAHHVSAISVHAAGAQEIVVADPQRAKAALSAIQQASREALVEMRSMVGVLGADTDSVDAPQPGLAELSTLVDRGRAAGLEISLFIQGRPPSLGQGVDLSAYRIAQEALTNILKHAPGAHADIAIRYTPDAVELTVRNDGDGGRAHASSEGGRGLVGMRERVALFNGVLEAGPTAGGGFLVHVVLPTAGAAG